MKIGWSETKIYFSFLCFSECKFGNRVGILWDKCLSVPDRSEETEVLKLTIRDDKCLGGKWAFIPCKARCA